MYLYITVFLGDCQERFPILALSRFFLSFQKILRTAENIDISRFLAFVKGNFPFFPLSLKTLTREKTYTLYSVKPPYVCVFIYRGYIFGGKIEKNGKDCYILEITSANHRHLYKHLACQCRSALSVSTLC